MKHVEFENTPGDIVALTRHLVYTRPSYRRLYVGALIFPVFWLVLAASGAWSLGSAVVYAVVYTTVLFLMREWSIRWSGRTLKRDGRNLGVLCRHRLTLDEAGVHETTDVNETKQKWEGIERVETTDSHIMIFISSNQAHVIPLHAFSTPATAEEFFEYAQSRWRKAASLMDGR
jgi:hypothetical protein